MAEFQLIDETITLIAALEGCELIAYEDVTGYAIGYGSHKHLDGRSVKKGDTITKEDAIKLLKQRVENEFFPHAKRILTNSGINSYQAGAVTSLIYNCGTGKITSKSSVIKAINANPEDPKIKDLFAEWRLSGGKVCEGLCKRRAREYEFYKNKKINMNVSYVYNSNLGGYDTNTESDAVVGNSKNETKYINTNYCASIKCYDEPEPVVGDGGYENYTTSVGDIVLNPLVYKQSEVISIINNLGTSYILLTWEYKGLLVDASNKNRYAIWVRRNIKSLSGGSIVAKLDLYLWDDGNFDVYLYLNQIDVKKIAQKINQHVDKVNKDYEASGVNTRFNKIDVGNGKFEEQLIKLRQYIIENKNLPDIDKISSDDVEKFQLFCCEKSKLTADYNKFQEATWPVLIDYLSGCGTREYDIEIESSDEKKLAQKTTWDAKCAVILECSMGNTFIKNKKGFFIGLQGGIPAAIKNYFNIKGKKMYLLFFTKTRKCVVFNNNSDTWGYLGSNMYICKKK
jgi:lysozyme